VSDADPKRWLDDGGGASDRERELLKSAGDAEPPRGAHAHVLAALSARLPPIAGGGAGAGGAPAAVGKSALGSTVAKAIAVVVIVGGLATGAVLAVRSQGSSTPTPPTVSAAATTSEPAPSAPPTPEAPLPTASAENALPLVPVAPVASGPPSSRARAPVHPSAGAPTQAATAASVQPTAASEPSSRADALRDENALLASARGLLRNGDARGALATLDTARARHPNGTLVQEREVLTVEALAQSGDSSGASRRAATFLKSFPASPHASHIRTFVR